MALIERDTAMAILAPYLAGVPGVFRGSWKRARKGEAVDLYDQTKTTRAQLMRDYAVGDLQRHWSDNHDVRFEEISQQGLFFIRNAFAIRIKKLDDASCSSNAYTPQDQNFRLQGQIEELGPTYNLELGYILDITETDIADVRVVCLNGSGPYWSQSIERPSDGAYDLFQGQRDPKAPTPKISPADSGVSIEPKKR